MICRATGAAHEAPPVADEANVQRGCGGRIAKEMSKATIAATV